MEKPDLYSLLKQFGIIGGMAEIGQSGFCLLMALWLKSNELNWSNRFTMTNTELLYRSGYASEGAMINKRNALKQLGYLDYIPPKKSRSCGTYVLNFELTKSRFDNADDYFKRSHSEAIEDNDYSKRSHFGAILEPSLSHSGVITETLIDQTKPNETRDISPLPPYQKIVEAYNSICVSLPKVKGLSDKRKKHIRARWAEHGSLEYFQELFVKAEESDFLSGRNGKWGGCGFDWLINESNQIKVMEGNYDNKSPVAPPEKGESGLAYLRKKIDGGQNDGSGDIETDIHGQVSFPWAVPEHEGGDRGHG
jgi:hypothetical protein